MNINKPHLPKQARALLNGRAKVATYESTGGKVTAQFAAHNLSLIDYIPAGSLVHDNMAGSGTVARQILAANPTKDIKIYASDIDQPFLDSLSEDVKSKSWPIEISTENANKLSFSDEQFTHSITNIGIFFTSDAGLDGAKEIYRTLKPGGVAVVNCWEKVSWLFPILSVHKALRGDTPFPAPTINWSDGQQLQKVMLEAGFKKENIKVEKSEAWETIPANDLRNWSEKTWAYLGFLGPAVESDEDRWDEAVDLFVKILKEQPGVKVSDGEVQVSASQWIIVATK
ncbi:hypothetical protein BDV96DRAFT_148823 [Lophiotrema nucula]|uniref:Methyltransferase domain-containing protein n=1 Tax=Lophiotrema nucula TaxID=690887 RepID=A0A6A5Z1R8_9PLEO|nr:hypothetical protein BDV96DRAFT_148823 [Lophiotrema nucula]